MTTISPKPWQGISVSLLTFVTSACMHRYFPQNTSVVAPPVQPYYEIRQPVVNTRLTAYPDVRFKPGDRVTVLEAGGCVNTGGSGRTWKDYVSPKGDEAARLYHGLIWIPGATQDGVYVPEGSVPMRIEGVIGKTYTIAETARAPEQLQLYLGYEDDRYHDNGYYKDKAGATDDQCKAATGKDGKPNIPPAYVRIRVEPAGAAAGAAQFKPFDIVATGLDPNGLLLNPIWWQQKGKNLIGEKPDPSSLPNAAALCGSFPSLFAKRTHGFALCPDGCSSETCQCANPCSSQAPSFDYPIDFSINKWVSCFGKRLGSTLNGHANWAPVTYHGSLWWAGEQVFDEDADMYLKRPASPSGENFDWSGFSHSFKEEIELEMAGYETWDRFGTEWFSRIWRTHKRDDPLGAEAQAIGLMSLDCVHECKVELHPVFAMAIHIAGPTLLPDGAWDDEWAIFARNWGNEGWCSHDQHYLDRNQVTFLLPGPAGATGVVPVIAAGDSDFENRESTPKMTEFKANIKGLSVAGPILVPGQGAKVTLVLTDAQLRPRINGFLHLRWTAPASAATTPAVPRAAPPHSWQAETEIEAPPRTNVPRRTNVPPDKEKITHLDSVPPETFAPPIRTETVVAEEKQKRDRSKLATWCEQEAKLGKRHWECGKSTQQKPQK